MASKLNLTYLDYSLETSTSGFTGVTLTAGNFAAQAALMDALVGAVQAIILGTKIRDSRIAVVTEFAETKPTSPFAQRELKWRVKYSDTVSPAGDGSLEIPTPDLDFLTLDGDKLDLTSTEGAAFVSAFEDFQRSRLGNTVTVVEVELVGRNN